MSDTPPALKDFAPRRLLVVDDDGVIRELLAWHYGELGFAVEVAEDGASGLAAMRRERPDIVLCDRRMPNLSGAEMLAEIRQGGPEWAPVVFAFVTALTDQRDRHAMVDLHPDAYLEKPIDFAVADRLLVEALIARGVVPGDSA